MYSAFTRETSSFAGEELKKLIYKVQINDTPGDEMKWKDYTYIGRNRLEVTGLISDKIYEFRIASISAEGLGGYGDPTAHKAL